MARIPTYQPQVQEQALPGARQQTIASPASFQSPDFAGQIGQGLGRAANAFGEQALNLQKQQDTADSTRLSAEFLTKVTDYKLQARQRQGDMVKGLPEESDKFYKDLSEEFTKNAPNDRVKNYIQTFAMQQQPSFHGYIGSHATEQIAKAEEMGFAAHVQALVEASALDPSNADQNVRDLVDATKMQLAKKGITDPDVVTNEINARTTQLHAGAINTLMVHDPKKAEAYFGVHKEQLTSDVRTKIEKSLELSGRVTRAQEGADSIMERVRSGAMTYSEAEAEARKQFSGDDRASVIQELRSQHSEYKNAQQEFEVKQFEPINKILGDYTLSGKAIPSGVQKEALQSLLANPEAYAKGAKLFDQHNDEIRREGQQAADRARALHDRAKALAGDGNSPVVNGLELKYDMLQNPEKWRNADLSKTLIPLVKEGALKPGDVEDAINLQNKFRQPGSEAELTSLTTAAQHLDARLDGTIIDGKPYSKLKPDERAAIKSKALQVLDPLVKQYQQATGEKATRDEVKKVVDSIFVDKTYRKTFMGISYSEPFQKTVTDFEAAPLRVQQQAVTKIPTAMRSKIIKALTDNGYEPTPANILEAYQRGR